MAVTMSISEARACLPDLIDRVAGGEEITITRHGQPVAVVVRPDALRVRRAQAAFQLADQVATVLDVGRSHRLSRRSAVSAERAEQLVAHVTAGRRRGGA